MQNSIQVYRQKHGKDATAETAQIETVAEAVQGPKPDAETSEVTNMDQTATTAAAAAETTSQPASVPANESDKKQPKAKKNKEKEPASSSKLPAGKPSNQKEAKTEKKSQGSSKDTKTSKATETISAAKQAKIAKEEKWNKLVAEKIKQTQIEHGLIEPEASATQEVQDKQVDLGAPIKKEPGASKRSTEAPASEKIKKTSLDNQKSKSAESVTSSAANIDLGKQAKKEPGVSQPKTEAQASKKTALPKAVSSDSQKSKAAKSVANSSANMDASAAEATAGTKTPALVVATDMVSSEPATGSAAAGAPESSEFAAGSADAPPVPEPDVTDMFGPDSNVDTKVTEDNNSKALFTACDLVVPGIAVKKMKQAIDDNPGSLFVAVLGADLAKSYRAEKPGVSKMVLGDLNKYDESFWTRASTHLKKDQKVTLIMAVQGTEHGFIPDVPRLWWRTVIVINQLTWILQSTNPVVLLYRFLCFTILVVVHGVHVCPC